MNQYLDRIVVIGAGLGGCAIALTLTQHNIPVTVYESRSSTAEVILSGLVLTPNGIHILDQLGVFSRVRSQCYVATHRVFKSDTDDSTTKKDVVASPEKYGYSNHRVWRKLLLDIMRTMLRERDVTIHYDTKLTAILSDSATEGVTFQVNGTPDVQHASLLIGSDGIYSPTRHFLYPSVHPQYTGTTAVLSHIRRNAVKWPYESYEANATIQGKAGALFFIAEDAEARELMIGRQMAMEFPELSSPDPTVSRAALEKLQSDKDYLLSLFRAGYTEWGSTARSILDAISADKESCFGWPFMRMPTLESWYSSKSGRIILVGDAAHAIPPSSGQGVNQALEDAWGLTLLMTGIRHNDLPENEDNTDRADGLVHQKWISMLQFWQSIRQSRIDRVFDWATNVQNVSRLPEAERKAREAQLQKTNASSAGNNAENDGEGTAATDMTWLYNGVQKMEGQIKEWLEREVKVVV